MGSKPSKSRRAGERGEMKVSAPAPRSAAPVKPQRQQKSEHPQDTGSDSARHSEADVAPFTTERRGFNNPVPARGSGENEHRMQRRLTRMIDAEDENGEREVLDERPFHQEKVARVPTKAVLRPPKEPGSVIADPDDDEALF